jgi:ABC-type transport system involved in multi-copper enzyme maturation permease subunit
MACCALKKQKKQLMILPVFLFLLSIIFGGSIILFLSLGGLFSRRLAEKRDRAWDLLQELLRGLKTKILGQPFLFDSSLRCKISGKMMRRSMLLAGAVYRYFNLIVLAVLIFSLFSLVQGARALGI